DKGWDARKRAYCLKIQPATGSFARNLIYSTKPIFDYIEMFYNSKRRHGSSDQMSPTEYENQYYQRLGSV
ncbi:IS3 family transposase, partial [Pantoea agglomerans]|uniref:IS3 family transposase n=1 Tax=Pantoea sp. AN62 TaxID=2587045 RepID=UPI001D0530A1